MFRRLSGKYEVLGEDREDEVNNSLCVKLAKAKEDEPLKVWMESDDRGSVYCIFHMGSAVHRQPSIDVTNGDVIATDDLSLEVYTAAPIQFAVMRNDNGVIEAWTHGHDVTRAILVNQKLGDRAALLPKDNPYVRAQFAFYTVPAGQATRLRLNREPTGKYLAHVGLLFDHENSTGTIVLQQHGMELDSPQVPTWFNLQEGEVLFLGTLAFGGELGFHTRWLPPTQEFGDDLKALNTGNMEHTLITMLGKLFGDAKVVDLIR